MLVSINVQLIDRSMTIDLRDVANYDLVETIFS